LKPVLKQISQIAFGLMSPENIREMSVRKIETPDTYDEDGYPIERGLMDPHLGVIDPSLKCKTCGSKGGECQGHFGSIELSRPVIHVGFGDTVYKILQSTCNKCSRILFNENEIETYTAKINEIMKNGESLTKTIKEIYKEAKTRDKCPYCDEEQEGIKIDKPISIMEGGYKLTPSEIRERLEKITNEDSLLLGVNPKVARPEWMILTVLPVPPVTVRPSITLETGERSEDDLTHKLVDILRINQRLIENMEAGAPQLIVEDLWELLQYHVITYFDNEASGIPPARHRSKRPLKTLTQRLKGKEGRFRSNLSGKRVNFSARTVISPDPNISINEVGVPETIAKEVTVPVHVNEWNIDEVKKYINNGSDVHPGANYVIRLDERKIRIYDETKEAILEKLEPGYIVERHLKDGDIVLFNRQPSLHRMSMMAHEVKILPYKTFRLNLCVCPPYNADFDGDEMNMHVFQTDESRAEAKSLMRVQEHIISPRFGGPIIGAIHDHISGAYLLTRKGSTFTEEQAFQIIRKAKMTIPKRKNRDWDGKELFSLLLPDKINMQYKAEICKNCDPCLGKKCHYDAYVVIEDGELITGAIDEKGYGSFSGKILDKIVKEYGSDRTRQFLDESTSLAISGIMKVGITTSTHDEDISEEARKEIQKLLNEAEDNVDQLVKDYEIDQLVEAYENGVLEVLPGRNLNETFKTKIMQVHGETRDKSGEKTENDFIMENYPEREREGIQDHLNKADENVDQLVEAYENDELEALPGKSLNETEDNVDQLVEAYENDELEALPGKSLNETFKMKIMEVLGEDYKKLKALPGRSLKETLEMRIMQVLGEARDKSGEIAENNFKMDNHSVIMATTGARASMLNLTQISACVGQQSVRGGRINRGYIERTLPHFRKNELTSKARGFVHSSYKEGLNPSEFYFHAMGGRDGLVDTALRTAQSGYMQRRLVNALQDVSVKDNGMVTDNRGLIIQTMFGEDGIDPAKSDHGKVADLDKIIDEMRVK
jgi:DNA-directed RNA polymerase subunit A'